MLSRLALGFCVLLMLGGAINHIISPAFYAPLVPAPVPLWLANVASTVAEGGIGLLLLLPRTRRLGAILFTALMVAFLPLHVWDLLKETPVVGSTAAAVVRLVFQALFIGLGAWLARRHAA